jgi:LmbE family N-acetylglucosaminyl deacetylase
MARAKKKVLRILGLGAHPDDMEWHCGGTLARYAAEGHKVFICHVSNGNKGSFRYTSDELARVRRREAVAAARVIGAESLTCDVPDGEVVLNVENERRITDAIRRARPDVVISVDPNDYHGDHRAVGEMAIHCTFMATCPLYKTPTRHLSRVPLLYFCDTSSGLNFQPTEYVDITDFLDVKVRMMMAHKSQLEWIAARHGAEIKQHVAEEFKAVARFRGMQCGVKYAEAFRVCPTAARITTYRVLP